MAHKSWGLAPEKEFNMAEQKMTREQMFEHIKQIALDINDQEVVDFCDHQIQMIVDGRNRDRKTDPAIAEFRENVYSYLVEVGEPKTAKDVATVMEERLGMGVSVQKASAALRFLAKDGKIDAVKDGSKAAVYTAIQF